MPTSPSPSTLPRIVADAETPAPACRDAASVSDAEKRNLLPVVAVDPGVNGGIAWWDVDQGAQAIRMPETDGDILATFRGLRRAGAQRIAMELPAKCIFGAGHSSLATLHRNVGFLQGVAMAEGFSLLLFTPQKWQAKLSLKKRTGEEQRHWKNRLKEEAQRRFPTIKVTLANADALLILASQQ
jgi:hypothetical protein